MSSYLLQSSVAANAKSTSIENDTAVKDVVKPVDAKKVLRVIQKFLPEITS
jgi:hypothetical protein